MNSGAFNTLWSLARLALATGVLMGLTAACTQGACGEGTEADEEGVCRAVSTSTSSSGSSGALLADMGDEGAACYPNNTCNQGLDCMGGRCQEGPDTTGLQGFACYPNNTCNAGLACEARVCVPDIPAPTDAGPPPTVIPDGSEGGDCYSNNSCDTGLYCVAGNCTSTAPQGQLNGACYPNSTCNAGLLCQVGRCITDPGTASSSSTSSSSGGGSGSSSGGGGSSSGGVGGARAFFEANLRDTLRIRCGACHEANRSGPDFMGAGPAEYYAKTVAYAGGRFLRPNPSQNSDFVLKGLHAGPAFASAGNPSERSNAVGWLELEAEERGLNMQGGSSSGGGGGSSSGGGPVVGPPTTATQAIQGFANCISPADFDAPAEGTDTKFNDLANQNSTQGRCYSCHATGAGGAFLSLNAEDTLFFTKRTPYVLKLALPSQDANGNYIMIPGNRFRDHGLEPGTHPRYTLNANRQAAVDQLFERTRLRFENNTENCRAGLTP